MPNSRPKTSLPKALTSNAGVGTGFATGHSVNRPIKVRPQENIDQPSIVTAFRQHLFLSRTVIVGTEPIAIIGSNELRRFISFQNNGGALVFLGFGIPVDITGMNAFELDINGYLSFEFGIVPNNEIWAVSTVDVTVSIIEGSIF